METLKYRNKQRIAIPILNSKPSSSFCLASSFLFIETDGRGIKHFDFVAVPPREPEFWPDWFSKMGVTDVIAQKIRRHTKSLLNHYHIKIEDQATKNSMVEAIYNSLVETGKRSMDYPFEDNEVINHNHQIAIDHLSLIDERTDISDFKFY